MTSLHRVLGTGPLGLATARALLARGHGVRLFNRRGSVANLHEWAKALTADLADSTTMRKAAAGG